MPTPSESIQAYVAAVNEAFDNIDTANVAAAKAGEGITGDIAFLKAELEKIQNSPGTLTPADQASLDASLSRVGQMATKATAFADSLKTLDEATAAPEAPAV